jgi:RHS repeat-associated protein
VCNADTVTYYTADVVSANDYSPFGAPLAGRSYTAPNSDYRFHFNGQEADDEIAGKGNIMTAQFWEYDSRLGRRWNLDPVSQVNISDYAAFRNNPIVFIDPNGDEVINGDKIKADKATKNHKFWSNEKSKYMNDHGITDKTGKRDFIKNGGSKEDWKEYKNLRNNFKTLKREMDFWNTRAGITQDIIDRWKTESPNVFDEVNKQNADFILSTKDLSGAGYFGRNILLEKNNGILLKPEDYPNYGKPAIAVEIDQNVQLSVKDIVTGQFSLNHEGGHFVYIVQNLSKYYMYWKTKVDLNGGHNEDDESGKKANEYGSKKDIK